MTSENESPIRAITIEEIFEFEFAFSPHSFPKFSIREESSKRTSSTKEFDEEDDIGDYERKRLQNIEERKEKFNNLRLKQLKKSCSNNLKKKSEVSTSNTTNNGNLQGIIKKRPGRPPGLTKAKILEKLQEQENGHSKNDYESLTDDDLMCPICYEKITEPIRLQCKHLLCQNCFEMLVDLTTLSQRKCPKCRRWIGVGRRTSDLLDKNLQIFICKKSKLKKENVKTERRLTFEFLRQESRQRYSLRDSINELPSSSGTSLKPPSFLLENPVQLQPNHNSHTMSSHNIFDLEKKCDETSGANLNSRKLYSRFTDDQLKLLENYFQQKSHPDEKTRKDLASKTLVSEEKVKTWFNNRRIKEKKIQESRLE